MQEIREFNATFKLTPKESENKVKKGKRNMAYFANE